MPYDRAGYLNNFGGYGNHNRSNYGSAHSRANDSKLLKKELHYVETYVKNHDEEYNRFHNNDVCDNYGYGCNDHGYDDKFGCGRFEPCFEEPIYEGCGGPEPCFNESI